MVSTLVRRRSFFAGRSNKGRARWRYKRFDTAAEAIRFAVEDITQLALFGVNLEVDEARFGAKEIRHLYEHPAYPLMRAVMKG